MRVRGAEPDCITGPLADVTCAISSFEEGSGSVTFCGLSAMTAFDRILRRFLLCSVLLVAALSGASLRAEQDTTFWQRQNIYQVITDRFFDGNSANNNADGNYNPSGQTSVHGGDFKGVEQKLDYIKSLGATAIWISPVVLNANGEFHGYAGRDFFAVDPHWGTLADLQHFIQTAHARGLLVIDDIIVNHGGDLIYSTDSGYPSFRDPPAGYNLKYRSAGKAFAAPFNTNAANPNLTNLFHNYGNIPDYNTAAHVELGELSGLDDFRTESPFVRSNMVEVYKYWIGQAGFDGFRIDTVKHVEMGFWQEWCPAIHDFATTHGKPNFFMFGEVYDGSETKCGSYTGTQEGGAFALDSVLDYPLYFSINSVFAAASGNTQQLEKHYASITTNYTATAQDRLVTFLDNHDQARFMSVAGNNTNRLLVALAFLYTSRGIPCLYYGTEQAFNGSTDPNDREDMFAGQFEQGPSIGDNYNLTHPVFRWVAKLNNFRRLYPALTTGTHVNLWSNGGGPGLFAYARRSATQEVFVVLNTASGSQTLPSRPTIYPAGTTIVNLLDTNETFSILSGPQTPPITVSGTGAKIFIALNQQLPLDPVVTAMTPSHDGSNVVRAAPIILQFSKPMDTGSVTSAFSTVPAVSGSFAWSPTLDTMTFTPNGTGFPAQTLVSVRLAETARDSVSSNSFFAAFEAHFRTGTNLFADLTPPTLSIQTPTDGAWVSGNTFISGTASDSIAVQQVEISIDAGAWITATGMNTWSLSLNTSNFLNGTHLLSARATDSSGNRSSTNTITVHVLNVPGAYTQRISAGNPANVTDCAAQVWVKDQPYVPGSFGYSGGTTGYIANTITGVCASAQSLYQREHYSTSASGVSYFFDCPVGLYEITLVEADTWVTGPGQRLFNVFIENRQVLTNFDIFAEAGGKNLPLSRVFTNAVSDGQLEIKLVPIVDNARAGGLQVRKLDDLYSGGDGIPDWWRQAYFDHPTGQADDLSRASDDADGDGASNLAEYLAGTNPRDPGSVFKIVRLDTSPGSPQILWTARSNKVYQLQGTGSIGLGNPWTNLGSPLPGTDGTLTQSLSGLPDSQYFRVQAQ